MDLVTELFGRNLINGRLNILATFVAVWLSGAVIAGLLALALSPSTVRAVSISLVPDGSTTIEIGETLAVDVFMVLDTADQVAGIDAVTFQLEGGGGLVTVTASTTGSVFVHPPSIVNTFTVFPDPHDFIAVAQFGTTVARAEAFLFSLTLMGAVEGSYDLVARRWAVFPLLTAPQSSTNRFDFGSDETLRIIVACSTGSCVVPSPGPMEPSPPDPPPVFPPSDSGNSGSMPVPEPSSWLLLSLGIAGMMMIRRKLASRA